jgi:hypothetical protein
MSVVIQVLTLLTWLPSPARHALAGSLKLTACASTLVAKAGEAKPNQKKIDEVISTLEPLSGETTLESHGISSGAWLVARPTQSMTSFASGECVKSMKKRTQT